MLVVKIIFTFFVGYILLFISVPIIIGATRKIKQCIDNKIIEDNKTEMWSSKTVKNKTINRTWNNTLGVWEIND